MCTHYLFMLGMLFGACFLATTARNEATSAADEDNHSSTLTTLNYEDELTSESKDLISPSNFLSTKSPNLIDEVIFSSSISTSTNDDVNEFQTPESKLENSVNNPDAHDDKSKSAKNTNENSEIIKPNQDDSSENFTNSCAACNYEEGNVFITGMNYTIKNNTVFINWDPLNEDNMYCKYNYTLKVPLINYVRVESFAGNNFTASPCEKYEVQLEALNHCNHGSVNSSVTIETPPGRVTNARINDSFLLSWDPPKRNECVTGYAIFISDKEYATVTENQHNLSDLSACEEYTIGITALSGGKSGATYNIQAIKRPDENIRINLTIEKFTNYFNIKLLQTTKNNCEKSFHFNITELEDDENNMKLIDFITMETTYSFQNAIPCGRYNVTAIMFSNEIPSVAVSEIVEMPTAPLSKFKVQVENTETTFAELKFILPPKKEYKCRFSKVVIECDQGYNISIILSILRDDDINGNMTGLVPFTKYQCTAKMSNAEAYFTVRTLEDAPSQVRNVRVSNVTETSFQVYWERPEYVPGILKGYHLEVKESPNYELPNNTGNCKVLKLSVPDYHIRQELTQTENSVFQIVDNVMENYNYEIVIRAKTIKYGLAVITNTTTKVPRPDSVQNLTYNIEIPQENRPMLYTSWIIPCRTFVGPDGIEFIIEVNVQFWNTSIDNFTESRKAQKENENQTFSMQLEPSSKYTLKLYVNNLEQNLSSDHKEITFLSPKGNTSEPVWVPLNSDDNQTDDQFTIAWQQPEMVFGTLTNYQINITLIESLHPDYCNLFRKHSIIDYTTKTYFTYTNSYSHHRYNIEITANTSFGLGSALEIDNYRTKGRVSSPINNLQYVIVKALLENDYDAFVNISFEPPCELNGILKYYLITLIDQQGNIVNKAKTIKLSYDFFLMPETNYKVKVEVVTANGKSIDKEVEFKSPAGIPAKPELKEHSVIVNNGVNDLEIRIRNDYFDNGEGEIIYYAVIVGVAKLWVGQTDNGNWNGTNWPYIGYWNEDGIQYQATKDWWQPFTGTTTNINYILGTQNCTGVVNKFCNGHLKPNTEYLLAIRGLTTDGYRDSNSLRFMTLEDFDKSQNTVLIIGIVSGVVVVLLLLGLGVLIWRRMHVKEVDLEEQKINRIITEEDGLLLPSLIKIEEFPNHYNKCQENLFLLKNEYSNLAKIGENLETTVAELPVNRKKNRYVNILPYDYTRVPLDSSITDYINASYIKGYSGKVEYIATQGPLEGTIADFWNMILKENCSVVAMVAQFKEQNKIKCHKYFPENREQIELDNEDLGELTIRCSYEMNFDFYMERQIVVQTGDKQYTITHLQFLNWPDFGCPEGTANMLQFTLILRRHMEENNSKAVIHCSAGVGRTGTIIAVDILLQTIRDGGDINIYETVAELRQQRQKMVQAETQYLYIYKCINDAILQPLKLAEIKAIDPIYENFENVIEMKVIKNENNNCNKQIEENKENNEEQTETSNDDDASHENEINDTETNEHQESNELNKEIDKDDDIHLNAEQ